MDVLYFLLYFFFFQAEDGIRDGRVTGVQSVLFRSREDDAREAGNVDRIADLAVALRERDRRVDPVPLAVAARVKIGSASRRERVKVSVVGGTLRKKEKSGGRRRYLTKIHVVNNECI